MKHFTIVGDNEKLLFTIEGGTISNLIIDFGRLLETNGNAEVIDKYKHITIKEVIEEERSFLDEMNREEFVDIWLPE